VASGSPLAAHWTLDPAVSYLNHGSFGAAPRAILEYQTALRAEVERELVDFLARDIRRRLDEVRVATGAFVGADPACLAFTTNATTAVNAAVRSWDLKPGDEILTTNQAYGGCWRAMEFIAHRRSARLVIAPVPFPLAGPQDVFDAVMGAVTPKTRLAVLDHVTSPTALVYPIERLVPALRARGVETIVDGAHALGMLPLSLDRLGAAVYTSNAHKWLCAPKGAAIVYVRADMRRRVRPLVASWFTEPQSPEALFPEEWDWTGTDDPTAVLCIPECIRVIGGMVPGGWTEVMARNHALAAAAREILMRAFQCGPPCPEEMLGSIASVPLPKPHPDSPAALLDGNSLATRVRRETGNEALFFRFAPTGAMLVRVSAQLYNDESQYGPLAEACLAMLAPPAEPPRPPC